MLSIVNDVTGNKYYADVKFNKWLRLAEIREISL